MTKLSIVTEGDTHVVVTRRFAAPPHAVFRAHTEPKLVQQWMLGPEGWTMPVCLSDARVGGRIRYEWSDGKGGGFYLTGEYLELEPFSRIVHVERMHMPGPTPDNHVETRFEADGAGTLLTMRMTLPSAEVRAAMLATGMEYGMEASYARLEGMAGSPDFKVKLDPPQILDVAAQPAAVIHLNIARSEMPQMFGPAAGELFTTLAAQGVEPVGAIFAHHFKMPPGRFDFELGIKVAAPVTAAGRVKPGELPAARVARTVYTGPYEGLPDAWNAFMGWIEAAGHTPAEDLWELYSVGPQSTPDPAGWRTELTRPLKG